MDWKSIYQSKRMTVNEAIALIHNGDKVVTGFACGEPLGIERALVEQYRNFQDVEIISMLTLGDCPWTAPKMAGHFHLNCLFASAGNRGAIANALATLPPAIFMRFRTCWRIMCARMWRW